MKLSPGQLRGLIAREARQALIEAIAPAPSYEPTNIDLEKITPREVAGDGSAEAALQAFFHDIYTGGFGEIFKAAKRAYDDYGKAIVDNDDLPPSQRSPGTNERLLRAYVRVLLERVGDEVDFGAKFGALVSFHNFYVKNKYLWEDSYNSEYHSTPINRALGSINVNSKEGLLKFIDDAGQQLDTLINLTSEFVKPSTARNEFENFKVNVWDPARKKLQLDMPSGQGNPVALRKRNMPQDFLRPPPTVPPEKKGDTWKNVTRTAQRVGKDLIKNIRGLGPKPPATKRSTGR